MNQLLEKILKSDQEIRESSIDFPREDLDLDVWKKEDNTYVIHPAVRRKILNFIAKYPEEDLIDIAAAGESKSATIHIVGSIGTNQYLDDSDIDVHIVVSKDSEYHGDEEFQEKTRKWFNEHRDEYDGYVGKHPIEIYLQYDPAQDFMSDSCYDLLADEWIVGPKIVSLDYDPYEDFSHIADDIRSAVQNADILFGELKRDLIDYDVIKLAMEKMPEEDKKRLLNKLKDKLDELENDIKALYKKRKEWAELRHSASKPATPEQALKDVELARKWRDTNAIFKFIDRYKYLKTIGDLEKLLADDEITPDEVNIIKKIVGV